MNRNTLVNLMPMTKLSQKLAVTAVAAAATALPAGITAVRLYATQAMFVEFEGTAVATGVSMYVPAGVLEYFAVPVTDSTSTGVIINAVRDSADGSLYITPLSA